MRQETIEKKLNEEKKRQELDNERKKMNLKIDEIINEFFEIVSSKSINYYNARFLFNNYFKIEAILLTGYYPLAAFAGELNERGFVITEKTLKTELFRIRKKLGRASIREIEKKLPSYFNWVERQQKIIEIFDTPTPNFWDYKKIDKRVEGRINSNK